MVEQLRHMVALHVPAHTAIVGMPGRAGVFAAEAHLRSGSNVVLLGNSLSSEIPEEDELHLKQVANRCGSWLLTPHTYAHAFKRGSIGIAGTAGTAIQQTGCLLNNAGFGISHIYSVGARDLGVQIRGLEFFRALEVLRTDKTTRAALLLLKPPAAINQRLLREQLYNFSKPLVVYIAGQETGISASHKRDLCAARSLGEAADQMRALLLGRSRKRQAPAVPLHNRLFIRDYIESKFPRQIYVRGFFSGGSCCDDSVMILRRFDLNVRSNFSSVVDMGLPGLPNGHICVDLGALRLANGRPHYPMIDLTLKLSLIEIAAADPATLVVLLDVFLGHGSHANPAQELATAIRRVQDVTRSQKRLSPLFIASVIGTKTDPQHFKSQVDTLKAAGVKILPSISAAAELAARVVRGTA